MKTSIKKYLEKKYQPARSRCQMESSTGFDYYDIERELLLGSGGENDTRAVKQFIMQIHPSRKRFDKSLTFGFEEFCHVVTRFC